MENNENGRSMIEMLGVLAIIGVLSVGGIMGYSKAMFRYKINKTIEQIAYIAGNVRTTFASQGNYAGIFDAISLQKKARIFPEDMWKDDEYWPRHEWEDDVYLYEDPKNSLDSNQNQFKAFHIEYNQLSDETCIELITHDWKNAQVKMIAVSPYGANPYRNDFFFTPPAKLDDAIKICNTSINNISFFFDVDTSDSLWKDQIDETTAALSGS